MTDNRTTELLCKLLEERGVDYTIDDSIKGDLITVSIEPKRRVYIEVWSGGGMAIWGGAITPEQAVAATLGSDDRHDEIYDAGFDSGIKATLQMLEGLIAEGAGMTEIEDWIDEQWKEYES